MERPRHLLLDFGGVCLVSPVELHRGVEASLGLEPNTFSWTGPLDPSSDPKWRRLLAGQITEREYWRQRAVDVGRAAGRDEGWALRDYFGVCYALPEEKIIRPGARSTVADVRSAGRKVGILTNDLLEFHGQAWVDSLAFFRDIDAVTDASRIGVLKPHPQAYLQALEDLGVSSEDVVFVDDQNRNVKGARDFGLTAVHFEVGRPDASWREVRYLLSL